MALIPVRSAQPGPDGTYFETEVGEAHLERFPDDYVRIDELDEHAPRGGDVEPDAAPVEGDAEPDTATEDLAVVDPTDPSATPAL